MRGIVLLCVFGTALGQGNWTYSWNGPGGTDDPAPENSCLTDPASCGCCVMQKAMWRMQHYFNTTLNQLERNVETAQAALSDIKASRTAFSVALTRWRRCVGPVRDQITVAYEHVFINLGQAYDVSSGVFTAPHSGIYSLAVTVWSDAGSPGALLAACASLYHNDHSLATLQERNHQDQEDTASTVLALQLQAGDTVSVRLPPGCFLCDDQSHYNTFSGFLLYTTD